MISLFKKIGKKTYKSKHDRDVDLYHDDRAKDMLDLAYYARAVNTMIRRTVDAGFLQRAYCTENEVGCLHAMRKILSDYYNEELAEFENPEWLFKKEILHDDKQEKA